MRNEHDVAHSVHVKVLRGEDYESQGGKLIHDQIFEIEPGRRRQRERYFHREGDYYIRLVESDTPSFVGVRETEEGLSGDHAEITFRKDGGLRLSTGNV